MFKHQFDFSVFWYFFATNEIVYEIPVKGSSQWQRNNLQKIVAHKSVLILYTFQEVTPLPRHCRLDSRTVMISRKHSVYSQMFSVTHVRTSMKCLIRYCPGLAFSTLFWEFLAWFIRHKKLSNPKPADVQWEKALQGLSDVVF